MIKPMVELTEEEKARARRIDAAISESRKTLDEIGGDTGVSAQAVKKWRQSGKIKTSSLIALAESVNEDAVFLYTGKKAKRGIMSGEADEILEDMTDKQRDLWLAVGYIILKNKSEALVLTGSED